jgi:hypothetical protein
MRNCFDQTPTCEHPTKINQFVGKKKKKKENILLPKIIPPSTNYYFLKN